VARTQHRPPFSSTVPIAPKRRQWAAFCSRYQLCESPKNYLLPLQSLTNFTGLFIHSVVTSIMVFRCQPRCNATDLFRSALARFALTNSQSLTNCPPLPPHVDSLSFQQLPNCPICKSFVLIFLQQCRGWRVLPSFPDAPKFRIFFQVPYAVSPLFATLTKTAGVYPVSSQFGTPATPSSSCPQWWYLSASAIMGRVPSRNGADAST